MLGMVFAFSIRMWIDGRQSEGDIDPKLLSMGLGGLLAPVIPAAISGWKGWALKPLLVAGVIVSYLLSGNPGAGILSLVVVSICYSTVRKVRIVAFYYAPSRNEEGSQHMRIITIDCAGMTNDQEFWDAYVGAAMPEGRGSFGRNLDAFWDAVSAGGPGWPGEDCELKFIHTRPLKSFAGGRFYDALKDIAARSEWVRIDVE